MKKIIGICLILVLLIAAQVSAQEIVVKVTNVTLTFLRHSIKIKHEVGEDSISIYDITSIRFIRPLGRVSITIYKGPTFNYDFGKNHAVKAKSMFTRMIGSVWKGFPKGERR